MPDDDHEHDLYGAGLLGESLSSKRQGNLAERFLIPPFTVLSARDGWWQDRKRAWIALGIQSELGRGGDLTWQGKVAHDLDHYRHKEGTRISSKDPAAPGGSLMPAMDYRNRERGNSVGKAIKDTSAAAAIEVEVVGFDDLSPTPIVPLVLAPKLVTLAPPGTPRPSGAAPWPAAAVNAQPATVAAPRALRVPAAPVTVQPAMPVSEWRPPELPQLRGRKIEFVALDTETTGLKMRQDRPVGISLKFGHDGPQVYLPWGHEGGDNLPEENVKRWMLGELAPLRARYVGAHLLFDLEMLARWGVELTGATGFDDVQVAEPLINEWRDSYSLDSLSLLYLGEGKDETLLRAAAARYGWTGGAVKANLWKMPARYVGPYAEADADLPLRIWEKQRKILEAEDLLTVYSVESRLIPVLLAMRRRGVRVAVPRAEALLAKLRRERDSWLGRLRALAPQAELRSTASLAPALRARGLKVPRTAPSARHPDGQDSVTEEWLVDNMGDAAVDAVMAGRRVDTMAIYVENSILGKLDGDRIYTVFNQLRRSDEESGARRGTIARLSSSDPNLQAVSKREKLADDLIDIDENMSTAVRSLFLPEDGEIWQRDDYSQEEFRLTVSAASGRGAEEARERYRRDPGLSFHKLAGELAGIDPDDKKLYDRVKALNLAKSYGAMKKKLARVMKCSVDEAGVFVQKYEAALPFTVETFNEAKRVADERGYIRTILGRRQRFPLWEPRSNRGDRYVQPLPHARALEVYGPNIVRAGTYMALNRYNQGSGADIIKKAMVDASEAGVCDVLGAFLLTEHDELDTSVPSSPRGDEAARELTRIMERVVELRVPLLVETGRGPTWGDCA